MAKTLEEVEQFKRIVREQTIGMNMIVSKIKSVDVSNVKLFDAPPLLKKVKRSQPRKS